MRVSRQAPANSPTAALRIAAQVGYPVDVAAGRVPGAHPSLGEDLRHAASGPDVRRAAALLLDEAPFVLVREWFPPAPRARLSVRREKGLGAYVLVVGVREERALVPLDGADAGLLARAAGAESESATAELLARIAAAAEECALTIEVELYVGSQPAVVAAASAQIRK